MTSSLLNSLKALSELGFQPVALNALYRFGLGIGHYKRVTQGIVKRAENREERTEGKEKVELFAISTREDLLAVLGESGTAGTLAEADEIVGGRVRLFGAEPVDLRLTVDESLSDWTEYEKGRAKATVAEAVVEDIKFVWEPARFGWAFTLGRAYVLSGDERYPSAFWNYFETFTKSNPPYRGPQWTSGQEAALRLMAFAWAGQVFAGSAASTLERMSRLRQSIEAHAMRIPPTLVYARAQQNNHLLTEAAGLFTAGLALPEHPQADKWRCLGWDWLNRGLQEQIDGYGEYSQHSTNYHRLMLQVVLWVHALALQHGLHWPRPTHEAVTRSLHWLLALLDPSTGQVPNLGANDGAYIFPLTVLPFADYRPVLNAAARAFLDYDLPHGPWDEMALWFGIPLENRHYVQLPRYLGDQIYGKEAWACLRTAQFTNRPSHADQLHLDLWWRGLNVARDAGTYLYNAAPPWDNSLTTTRVHNTVTVDGQDQMTQAGRFLYLDWVNAYRRGGYEADESILQRLRGRYRNFRLGYRHTRLVSAFADGHWRIEDGLVPLRLPFMHRPACYSLQWLLPDWEWKMELHGQAVELRLLSPHGWIRLTVGSNGSDIQVTLVRAGVRIGGGAEQSADPVRGWYSPTYGVKEAALSLALECRSADEVQFISEFFFPEQPS